MFMCHPISSVIYHFTIRSPLLPCPNLSIAAYSSHWRRGIQNSNALTHCNLSHWWLVNCQLPILYVLGQCIVCMALCVDVLSCVLIVTILTPTLQWQYLCTGDRWFTVGWIRFGHILYLWICSICSILVIRERSESDLRWILWGK